MDIQGKTNMVTVELSVMNQMAQQEDMTVGITNFFQALVDLFNEAYVQLFNRMYISAVDVNIM